MDVFDLVARLRLDSDQYRSDLDNARDQAERGGSGIGKALGTAAKVGAAALTAATGAAVAFGASAVNAGMDFDQSMSQVAATMGYTVADLNDSNSEAAQTFQALRDFAQEMGRSTAFSATEAADALNYMALAGYDAEKSMEMLPNVLNLAAAGGMDLARASDMVTDAASALGLTTEGTASMVDMMAAASSKSNTSVSQLGEAILTIGATARGVKGGVIELSTVLGVLADNGIKGSEGGTHLRNMIMSLQSPTSDGAKALEQLGISVYDSTGNMRSMISIIGDMRDGMAGMTQSEKDSLIGAIFNKTDAAAVNALLNTTQDRFNELWRSIGAGTTLSANITEEGIRQMQQQFSSLFESTGGDIEQFSEKARKYLKESFDISDSNIDAAIAAFVKSMGEGATSAEELYQALANSGSAAQAMADMQLDNLAGDITLFQSALEGARIAVSDELTPTIREFVQFGSQSISDLTKAFKEDGLEGALDALDGIIDKGIEMIFSVLPTVVNAGIRLLEGLISGILNNLPKLVEAATQIIISLTHSLVENLPQLLYAAVQIIFALADGLIQALPGLIPAIVEIILIIAEKLTDPDTLMQLIEASFQIMGAIVEGIINAIPTLIEALPQILENILVTFASWLPQMISSGKEMVQNIWNGINEKFPELVSGVTEWWGKVKDETSKAWETIKSVASEKTVAMKDMLKGKWDEIKSAYDSHGGGMKGAAAAAVEAVKQSWTLGFDTLNTLTGGKLDTIKNTFSRITDSIKTKFNQIAQSAINWGKDLVNNFINGLMAKWESLKQTVSNIAQSVRDFLGFSEPKEGPLSNFHTYAPDMMELFAKGIRDNEDMLKNTIADTFDFGRMTINSSENTRRTTEYGREPTIPFVVQCVLNEKVIGEASFRYNIRMQRVTG